MALSNADRQRRFRERAKKRMAGGLTAEQISDRDAVASEPIWPVPNKKYQSQVPCFLGWNRYDWSAAPRELAEHVGLLDAWEGWKAEHEDMQAQMKRTSEIANQKVEAIRAECGDQVMQAYLNRGSYKLISDYEAGLLTSPTTDRKRKHVT